MSSHPIHHLEQWAAGAFAEFAAERAFTLTNKTSGAMWASLDFENSHFALRLVIERGYRDIELTSLRKKGRRESYSVPFFKDLKEPAQHGRWNLGVDEQLAYLRDNYAWFQEVLAEDEWARTCAVLAQRCSDTFATGS